MYTKIGYFDTIGIGYFDTIGMSIILCMFA